MPCGVELFTGKLKCLQCPCSRRAPIASARFPSPARNRFSLLPRPHDSLSGIPARSGFPSLLSFVWTKYCGFSPLPLKTHLGTPAAVLSILRVHECWSRVAYAQWWGSSLLDKCVLPHHASLHPLWVKDECGGGEGLGSSFWLTCLEWQKGSEWQKERSLHSPLLNY